MAETGPSSASDGALPPEGSTAVNLQVLSPSVGINAPLSFHGIPASTTVRQLKEKIRSAVTSSPADEQQRLIHRGRLLAREEDTLQDVFGKDAIRTGEQQTLHLVLRDVADHHTPSSQPATIRGHSPIPGIPSMLPAEAHLPPNNLNTQARLGRVTPVPGMPNTPPAPGLPGPQLTGLPPHLQAFQQQQMQMMHQQQHQNMVQWMNQLQRDGGYRQLVNQQQRERAAMGMHGAQDAPPSVENASGRSSPAIGQPVHTHTTTREGIGPNGQYWRVVVNETAGSPHAGSPAPTSNPAVRPPPFLPPELQNIMRGPDATQATQAMTDAMHRSASGASLANMANINAPFQAIPPGVTTSIFPGASRQASRTATPDPALRTPSHGSSSVPVVTQATSYPQQPIQPQISPPSGQPEVYILSGPNGPRALLVNNPTEAYFTNSVRTSALASPFPLMGPLRQPPMPWGLPQLPTPPAQPQGQPIPVHIQPAAQRNQADQPQQRAGEAVQVGGAVQAQPQHPPNPGAGAFMAAVWPHIWLVIRLAVFVWWFTAADSSWNRWMTVIAIALTVFIINTGWLNGFANQAWEPFRRHLEGLLPLGDPAAQAQAPAAPPGANPQPQPQAAAAGRPPQQPDPAAAAARLVADRRNANANWLMDRVRRAERASLLFLASIAPGVAERHIAAQERVAAAAAAAQQQEQQAAEAAEALVAAAAAAAVAEAETEALGEEEEERRGRGRERERDAKEESSAGNAVSGGSGAEGGGRAAAEQAETRPVTGQE